MVFCPLCENMKTKINIIFASVSKTRIERFSFRIGSVFVCVCVYCISIDLFNLIWMIEANWATKAKRLKTKFCLSISKIKYTENWVSGLIKKNKFDADNQSLNWIEWTI